MAADKAYDLVHRLGLCRRKHGAGVRDRCKLLQYFTGDLLRWGAGNNNAGVILQHL